MKIRYNLIFMPLLIICAVAVWYFTQQDIRHQTALRLADRSLVDIESLDIIEIIQADEIIRLERVGHSSEGFGTALDWKITRPWSAGCDPPALAELLDSIITAEAERDFTDVTEDQLQEYGLLEPALELKLMSTEGSVQMDLAIGVTNPSGASRYAYFTNDPQNCFLVAIYDVRPFEVKAEELRDTRAVDFESTEYVSIQLSSVQGDLLFERHNQSWLLTSPQTFEANPDRMEILFQNIRELRAVEFLPVDASDPELNAVSVELKLHKQNGSLVVLTLHGEDISRGYFTSSSYQPTSFITEAYIYERLALRPEVFFTQTLIRIPRGGVFRVLVREPDADNVEIERTGSGEGDWRLLRPSGTPRRSAQAYVSFIESVFDLRPAARIPPPDRPGEYGLEPVFFMLIEVYPESGEDQTEIYIGDRNSDGNYYSTTDFISFILLPADLVQNFINATDSFRSAD